MENDACSCKMKEPSKNDGYREVFDSGMTLIKVSDIVIRVPMVILAVCNQIQEKVGNNEFSIFCKGQYTSRGYELSHEFVIPEQDVGGATVDYLNEDDGILRSQGWNVVIHSHPFQMHNFSSSDEETINHHFTASVLYSQGKFVNSRLNIDLPGARLQLEPKVIMDVDVPQVAIDISKIHHKTYNYRSWWEKDQAERDAEVKSDPVVDYFRQFC